MKYKKVLLLGSGALTIGQAGEFDYSGSQAIQSFIEEGMHVIVVNPNIATVQTNPKDNVSVYLYPVNAEWVKKIILKEKPDCIAAGFGGQTAISCLIDLEKQGILAENNVKVLGSSVKTLHMTEDRGLFAEAMMEIDIPIVKSKTATTIAGALEVAREVGYPLIVRAAYALGGLGSGFAHTQLELETLVKKSFSFSSQVLVESSLVGWKEVEYEVMRDVFGNTICICNMENFDPLGVHTGDSIVISPSQTLTNADYQLLRDSSIKIANHLNIIGECNVQYALSPDSKSYFVIEVNARLSRSSALASKATGYPIALVAAKVVLGHSLVELRNPLTLTSAFFEPALDYLAVKYPRWDLAKFEGLSNSIGSTMKSIGEVMSLGRSFPEAFQKAVRMVQNNEMGIFALNFEDKSDEELLARIKQPCTERSFIFCELLYRGKTVDILFKISQVSPWFLNEISKVIIVARDIEVHAKDIMHSLDSKEHRLDRQKILVWKKLGFSDTQIIYLATRALNLTMDKTNVSTFRKVRKDLSVTPKIKRMDTSSGEFPTDSNYLYLTYHGDFNDVQPIDKKSTAAIILGSGAYKIGSSVEFDWAAVCTSLELKKNNVESIVINCNPETVSTDFNISSRLYFEELSIERVMDIYDYENSLGIISCLGGQVSNNLIASLSDEGANILGHNNETLELTENRVLFSAMLNKEDIDQPNWIAAHGQNDIDQFVEKVGFPILIRPSFVLSGAFMRVVYNADELNKYLQRAKKASPDYPIILTAFIMGAKEIEVDGVAQNGEIVLSFISEHIECAGIHSGDATIVFPPQKLYSKTVKIIEENTRKIVASSNLNGPFNIQFLALDNEVKVIECNARASRTLPFISKVSGINIIEICTQVFLSKKVEPIEFNPNSLADVGVKAAMFSFNRLEGVDPIMGVEMASTGEAGCIDEIFENAFLLAMESTGIKKPKRGVLLSTGMEKDKLKLLPSVQVLQKMGLELFATPGTHAYYKSHGIELIKVQFPNEQNIEIDEIIRNNRIDLVINIPKSADSDELDSDVRIRLKSIQKGIPILTDSNKAKYFIDSFQSKKDVKIKSLGEIAKCNRN
jgi:carbamoyl-phosphate synthase large subunit